MQNLKDRVMIIDDEEFCIMTMKHMMKIVQPDVEEHKCDVFLNGLEALNQIKSSYECGIRYKIIFSDLCMPHMDGIEAAGKIREFLNQQNLPPDQQPIIIGITGHTSKEYADQAIKAGMNQMFTKPFSMENLARVMETYYNN